MTLTQGQWAGRTIALSRAYPEQRALSRSRSLSPDGYSDDYSEDELDPELEMAVEQEMSGDLALGD